jgi:hypothetical protein
MHAADNATKCREAADFDTPVPTGAGTSPSGNRSKLADTSSQALPTAPLFVEANTVDVVLILFMALLSFRGISTPSLPAQGEQRRFSYFNIQRGNPAVGNQELHHPIPPRRLSIS